MIPNAPQEIPQDALTALFPGLGGTSFCKVNLQHEGLRWQAEHPDLFAGGANPLLDPLVCQKFLDDVHARLGVLCSYGGYLEDRSRLWKGSYLDRTGAFVHLGVDFHVPQGTLVAAPRDSTVLLVDDDQDRDGGWGPRVFLKLDGQPPDDPLLIFAHLQQVAPMPGKRLRRGSVFAEVGGPPDNGNWAPHLHIQTIASDRLVEVLVEKFSELDGYGPADQMEILRATFPDPLPIIGWQSA